MKVKEKEMRKQLERYASDRVREKRYFGDIIKKLDAELHDKQIEPHTYERLIANLETQFYQKQEREWARIRSKIDNLLSS
jgi:FKBP-type peptidyl-prolyl cis-trans isomerase (trigger factor)